MYKILLTSLLFFSCVQLLSAQVEQLAHEKKRTTIRLYCGHKISSSSPPLYILQHKQQEYLIDSAELQSLVPADLLDVGVLKNAAAVEKYGDRGKNGVIILKVKKAVFKRFLPKEGLN